MKLFVLSRDIQIKNKFIFVRLFIILCLFVSSVVLFPKQHAEAQSSACAAGEVDTLSYMLPSSPKITTVQFNTGAEESYSTVKKGTSQGKSCFYIIKGTNFEQYCYDSKYIYFMQDTSWATGPNQDVMCQGTDSQATLSLVDPATNKPGAKAFNRCQKPNQNFTFDQKIVPVNEDTCQKCSVSGVAPTGSAVTGRFEVHGDYLHMISVAGAGQGERRIFKKNCGLWGFQFGDGQTAQPIAGKDCQAGTLPTPENACTLGGNEPLVLRDPASLLLQEGFNAASGAFANYYASCSPMKTFEGKLTGQNSKIIIDGVETNLTDYCLAHPKSDACIFKPSGDFLASLSENAKVPLYSSDGVGTRNTSYMDFMTNQSPGEDFIATAPYYKLTSPEEQCVQNIGIMRAVNQICQTLPAVSYQELVSGGSSVLGTSSDGGVCSVDAKLTTPKGSKRIMEVYEEIKNLQDLDPNDNFTKSEDYCKVVYPGSGISLINNDQIAEKADQLLPYVKNVSMFRNVYEVGYIVYVRDYVPTTKTIFEILFPFFSFDNSNRKEIPIQIQPVLFPYALSSQKTIESDKGSRPRDYVTGFYNTTLENFKTPEEIRQEGNKEIAEIDRVDSSFPQGYPTLEDESTCSTYICCPECQKILAEKKGTHDAKFDEKTFKAIVGAYINKNIAAGTMSDFNTRYGIENNQGLSGDYQTCRVTQETINGETAKQLGSSLVQPSVYPSIIDSVFNFLGIVKVGGTGSSSATSTSVRVFVITPDEARAMKTNEGNNFARFLNPDYMEYENKKAQDIEDGKIAGATNPILQLFGIDQGFSSNDDTKSFDKPGSNSTPNPSSSPTPTPQADVVAGINLKGEKPKNGEGGVVAGGMFGRELYTLLGNILSAPDSPTYSDTYTSFEDYWTGKDTKKESL